MNYQIRVTSAHLRDTFDDLDFSPDAIWLATASRDRAVRIWEVVTGKLWLTLSGHTRDVKCVAWSPDGDWLASGSEDETVRLWEVASGKLLHCLIGHGEEVHSVEWSAGGKLLTVGTNSWDSYGSPKGGRTVWDADSGSLLERQPEAKNHKQRPVKSADGKLTATASPRFDTIQINDAESGNLLREIRGHQHWVKCVAWSPDGSRMADGGGSVRIWEVASGKLLHILNGLIDCLAWSPDGKHLASSSHVKDIRLWDAAQGKLMCNFGVDDRVLKGMAWSGDGKRLKTCSVEQTMRVWETASGALLQTFELPKTYVGDVAWSADEKLLATSDTSTINLWSATNGERLRTLAQARSSLEVLAWSADSKMLATRCDGKSVVLWDVASGAQLHALEGQEDYVCSITFSPDQTLVAALSARGKVMVWSVKTGAMLQSFAVDLPAHQMLDIAFASTLASSTEFGQTPYGEPDVAVTVFSLNNESN